VLKCAFQESSPRTSLSAHKSKSYEERELEYNEARSRIFNTDSVSNDRSPLVSNNRSDLIWFGSMIPRAFLAVICVSLVDSFAFFHVIIATPCRARLVLGWVTVLSWYLTIYPGRFSLLLSVGWKWSTWWSCMFLLPPAVVVQGYYLNSSVLLCIIIVHIICTPI